MKKIFFLPFLMIILILPNFVLADSLRCGNQLVSSGDLSREVEEICGPPGFIDAFQEKKIIKTFKKISKSSDENVKNVQEEKSKNHRDSEEGYQFIGERSFLIDVEEWTYNWGSNNFIRTLTFRNHRLITIEVGSYGYDKTDRKLDVSVGDSKAIVMMKYGPTTDIQKDLSYDVNVTRKKEGEYLYVKEHFRPILEEEWVYDLGPDKYLQQLVFRNNSLVRIKPLKIKGVKIGNKK